jgi:phytoene synthase
MSVSTPDLDLAACGDLLRHGSRSFFAAAHLLPARLRAPATALYGFCRLADDAIDQSSDPLAALAELQQRVEAIYAKKPFDIAADRAFAVVVHQFAIPRELPLALLEGFAWDAAQRRYEDLSELTAYAVRVAGTVGMMMALLMGVREESQLARANDLGIAMQFTNIARDVGEDARAGRLYLPLAWLREAGIEPEELLREPAFSRALARVTARLLAQAEVFYRRADRGLQRLPLACRPGLFAARHLYAEIGHEVARRGWDSVSARAQVSTVRKLSCMAGALRAALPAGRSSRSLAAPEATALIDAIAAWPLTRAGEMAPPWWNLQARVERTLLLFERLERLDRENGRAASEWRPARGWENSAADSF